MLDIDNFKKINDEHGHIVGDKILRYSGDILNNKLRLKTDLVARYGGDEFIVIRDLSKNRQGTRVSNIIENIFKDPIYIDGIKIDLYLSAGLSIYPDHGLEFEELIKIADAGLYEAKKYQESKVIEIIKGEEE